MPGNAAPTVHVDVAFGVPPLTRPGALDWVRVGQVRVRELTTSRGARIKTGEPETGEATATLDDLDGVLDPTNTASPYAPDVLLRTRVRFVVEHSGGGDVIWTGFIKSLPLAWRREVAVCTLGAAGLLWLIATGPDLPPSVLHQTTVDSGPVAYWPLTEDSGTIVDDVIGVHDGVLVRPVTDQVEMVPFDPRQVIHFVRPDGTSTTGQRVSVHPFDVDLSTGFTIVAWIKATGDWPNSTLFAYGPRSGSLIPSIGFGFGATAGDTTLHLTARDGTNFAQVESAPVEQIWDRGPHRVAVTVTTAGVVTFSIDGQPIGLHPLTTHADASAVDFTLIDAAAGADTVEIGWARNDGSTSFSNSTGGVGHVAIWDRDLSAAELAADYEAGVAPWDGDRTGERLGRILDLIGVDAGDRDIDTGIQTCSPALLGGNPGEYLRKLATTEAGTLFESADGKLTFRQSIANNPTVVHTFSDDPDGDAGTAVGPVDPDYSTDRVINAARVTRENGSAQTASDATSISTYGELSAELSTLHSTPSGARARAASLVIRNRNPKLVFPGVTADHIDTDAATLTGTDVGEAVTVIARPPRGGTPIDQTSIVERVGHRLAGGRWTVDFGVVEHLVLPLFSWDTPGQGWDESVWADL